MITAQQIISGLDLKPHPKEGGFFREVYRSKGKDFFYTTIYYLLTPETVSNIHRLRYDEIFHFYLGDPVEMVQLKPGGIGEIAVIGADLLKGENPLVIVPKNVWQGARLIAGGKFALLGTTTQNFNYDEYETGKREMLVKEYPDFEELITALT